MISYQFSKREKVLLAVLALIVAALAWYVLVFQNTVNESYRLDSRIAETQSLIDIDTSRVSQMAQMQHDIEQRKAEGAVAAEVPAYDNLQPLMADLNRTLSLADSYSLSFDKLDEPDEGYVKRSANISFECASYAAAESLVNALANGTYPCMVDSVSIVDSSSRAVSRSSAGASATVQITFFEKA